MSTASRAITMTATRLTSKSSFLIKTAIQPSVPPSASEPTSPIKIVAGWQLNHRNPKLAPMIAEQMMANSPAPETCGINKYSLNVTWPVI